MEETFDITVALDSFDLSLESIESIAGISPNPVNSDVLLGSTPRDEDALFDWAVHETADAPQVPEGQAPLHDNGLEQLFCAKESDYPQEDGTMKSDVLMGRGGKTNKHKQNTKYRAFIATKRAQYWATLDKKKTEFAQQILSALTSRGIRFMKENKEQDRWFPVEDKKAIEKIKMDLRNKCTTLEDFKAKRDKYPPGRYYENKKQAKKKTSVLSDDDILYAILMDDNMT